MKAFALFCNTNTQKHSSLCMNVLYGCEYRQVCTHTHHPINKSLKLPMIIFLTNAERVLNANLGKK